MTWAKRYLNLTIKTVSRPKDTSVFIVLPRRWVVERSLARMMNAWCSFARLLLGAFVGLGAGGVSAVGLVLAGGLVACVESAWPRPVRHVRWARGGQG